MPRLWTETIEEHRRAVRDAILDTTASLVAEHGFRSVTMSRIAEHVGIGRATLYKYFTDVEAILLEWHQQQIARHLVELEEARDRAGGAVARLQAVLETFAALSGEGREHHDGELAVILHRHHQVAAAQQRVRDMLTEVIAGGAAAGELRDDVSPHELALYCLHALSAAGSLPSKAAVRRLVAVTLDGLRRRA
jgi:AcrR family transcriptional regulator